jgi:cystathionine beta-synthase
VLFHDHGSRYIGKIFNDDWMKERGFLEEDKKIASEIVASHNGKRLITADVNDPLSKVMVEMKQFDISQVPVFEDGKSVGSISDHSIFQKIMDNPKIKEFPVKQIMEKPFPEVDENYSINELSKLFNNENRAVLVNFGGDKKHIITLQDMMNAIGN